MKKYPFVPKSNKFLERGDFWPIKLSNGHYAAGVVLEKANKTLGLKQVHIGLTTWSGKKPPLPSDLDGKSIIEFGRAHIKTITERGSQIIGNCKIHPNFALPPKIDAMGVWGYDVINIYAEKHFVNN